MNFARGLLNDPWILFLDEPTLGLDVAAARQVRELVLAWKEAVPGRTVLLTTHYMAEADELCERIAIVDHGRILAIGTPDELKKRGPARVDLPPRARPARWRPGRPRPAARRRVGQAAAAVDSGPVDRQTVAVNLVLDDDGALGGVVGALGGLARTSSPSRSRSRASRTSSSSSSDAASTRPRPGPPGRRPARRATPTASPTDRHHGRRRGSGGGRLTMSVYEFRHTDSPQQAADWTRASSSLTDLRAVGGRAYPRVSGLFREKSWLLLRDPPAVPRDVGLRVRLPGPAGAARVHRLRRPGRGDDGVLAERHLDDGQPAVVGEEPGQPRALLRGPDVDHERALRDGRRGHGHELDPGVRRPGRRRPASTRSSSPSSNGSCSSRSSC